MTDVELLREYTTGTAGAQRAFAELVQRHGGWVYAVARRRLGGEAHLAEDVTQAVFFVLARKADRLSERTVLAAWLFQVTRMTVWRALRDESRRRRRETEAFDLRRTAAEEAAHQDDAWRELEPVLDESVARLAGRDRDAVLLRYYQRKSFAEVGAAIGATEDAARKRVARAVEKLRGTLASRGVAIPEAGLAAILWEHSGGQLPASLTGLTSAVVAEQARISVLQLVKGAVASLAWQQARIAILWAAAIVTSGALGVSVVRQSIAQAKAPPPPPPPVTVNAATSQPQPPKVTQATPILAVRDISTSVNFYTTQLGFRKTWEWGNPAAFVSIERDDALIFLAEREQGQPGTWIYLAVNDVDAIHKELVQRRVHILEPPADRDWGMREMLIEDPDGHHLRIGAVRDQNKLPPKGGR